MGILHAALRSLKSEYEEAGREKIYHALEPLLASRKKPLLNTNDIATTLGMSKNGVDVSLFRMRRRFRELLRNEVAGTVTDEEDLESELTYLRSLFMRTG
jgi:RNA polymerase sigma-70 factor (ECF subfamily)